jgi:hypothetical protein
MEKGLMNTKSVSIMYSQGALIRPGCALAASRYWRMALGRSATG